ncbi:DUF4328 domain-containing protein [Streptomyces sp. AK02-01A]|uniref:DUF4328 domain-containing protein n=1 Tax=Streptomyces sp. AK02-01A TaxID=3028648 RepID=UPI0029A87E24|nr:DUF4328 domain-containing protein [Streptomyces sp. AK02-01A]MDX3852279.1 DUF4328 domain-containing protein [Streptomyces sp. AK02-01A]
MLCTHCRARAAVTGEGLCGQCAKQRSRASAGRLAPAAARLSSPVGLSKALVVLFCVVIATDLFSLVAGANIHGLMSDVVNGDYAAFTDEDLDRADQLYARSGVFQVNAMLPTAVVFLVWFFRVRRNAGVFDQGGHRMGQGWAVGSWFVPLWSFWLPRRVAADTWAASTQAEQDGTPRRVSYGVVNVWWAAWVGTCVVGWVSTRLYQMAEEADEVRNAVRLEFAADVIDVVAAVLAIRFVLTLTRMQRLKATQGPVALAAPAGPVPPEPQAHEDPARPSH